MKDTYEITLLTLNFFSEVENAQNEIKELKKDIRKSVLNDIDWEEMGVFFIPSNKKNLRNSLFFRIEDGKQDVIDYLKMTIESYVEMLKTYCGRFNGIGYSWNAKTY